jgi:hypothetical protein
MQFSGSWPNHRPDTLGKSIEATTHVRCPARKPNARVLGAIERPQTGQPDRAHDFRSTMALVTDGFDGALSYV